MIRPRARDRKSCVAAAVARNGLTNRLLRGLVRLRFGAREPVGCGKTQLRLTVFRGKDFDRQAQGPFSENCHLLGVARDCQVVDVLSTTWPDRTRPPNRLLP